MDNVMQAYRYVKNRFDLENIPEIELQLLASEVNQIRRNGFSENQDILLAIRLNSVLGEEKYEYYSLTLSSFNNEKENIKESAHYKYLRRRVFGKRREINHN
ncbi:MAG: hypothetical protein AABW56_02835 [Nanoarchaeota archaeon]